MWQLKRLSQIDMRVFPILFLLMCVSLLTISSYTQEEEGIFFTTLTLSQIKWYACGMGVYLFFASFDYNKLREWTWILYTLMILSLIGLFFVDSIQRVHRWYKIPLIGVSFQPSEYAKLIVVIALSWYLERKKQNSQSFGTAFGVFLIAGIPFFLILKQPDLGTALVLLPVTCVICYIGNLHPIVVKIQTIFMAFLLVVVALIFLGGVKYETLRPYASKVLKEYQFERLNPNTPHQRAACSAIALGGIFGKGWRQSEFTKHGWLPAAYTDSIFPAFGEEFGFLGEVLVLLLYYALIFFCFQVSALAKDEFGRLLAAGITVYLMMHILVNVGMMCGFLPITGVPLVFLSYGGSSILSTMTALGILQSIYSRRFTF